MGRRLGFLASVTSVEECELRCAVSTGSARDVNHLGKRAKNSKPCRSCRGTRAPSAPSKRAYSRHAVVAQTVEHLVANEKVVGSVPTSRSKLLIPDRSSEAVPLTQLRP